MLNKKLLLPLIISALIPATTVMADDAALTKEKCGACHGADGNSKESKVPSIAGFTAETLEDILEQFSEGDRKADKYTPEGGKETDMSVIAKALSEEDRNKITAYLAKQSFKPVKQAIDEALAKVGKALHKKKCEKCHADGGSNVEDDTAILAGQWEPYLQKEFDSIAAGERDVPKKMKKRFKKLSAEDRTALIKYYVSQQ